MDRVNYLTMNRFFEDIVYKSFQLKENKKKSNAISFECFKCLRVYLGKAENTELSKVIDKLVVERLINDKKIHEDEEQADEFASYRLFSDKAANHVSRLRAKIEIDLEMIIEKKLLHDYLQNALLKHKFEEFAVNEVDNELNQYIFNLKTDLEKTIALLSVNQQYVGMLSRTHREMRKDCLLRLHSESEEGEKWSRKFDPDELADESSEVKANEADEDVTTNEENQEENLEVDIVGHEEFAGFIKKEAFDHYQSKGFDDKFFVYSDSALVLPSEKKETYQTLSNFFIENRGNWPTMHKYLNYASHEYIERLVAALFIQSPLEKHVLNQFITLFTNLSTNPLNEIRFMDMIVTLASLDAEDANTLNTFNQYFGTVLTKDEFASKKHSFLGEVINIIEEYLSLTIEGKNAVEHSHFDELLASTEKIGEIMPFKLKIKIVASVVTPKVVYSAIARKIIDSDSDNKQLFEKAVKAIIKVELTHLSPYHKDPVEASHAVQAALECMVSVDKMSKLRMNLLSSIANCLENDHVLFSFLNLLQQTYHMNLECAHQELVNIVATLKLELKGEADNDQVKEILKQISQNKDLVKIQLVLQLLAKQSENVIQSLKEAKDRFTTHQESLCANLKKLIANLLEEKGLKNIYMYAIQIFELLEDIKKATSPSDWDLSQLESALDLIVDMYRIFKAHGSLAEIEERIGFVGVSKEEIKQDGKETTNTSSQMFSRVSTKTNDLMPQEEELLLSIPELQRSMTAIRESGEVKYDELLSRLTVKAKSLVQEVKLSKLPSAKYVLEIAVKREYERFTQFPWLLKFDKKMEIFDMLLSKEKDSYSSDTLSTIINRHAL